MAIEPAASGLPRASGGSAPSAASSGASPPAEHEDGGLRRPAAPKSRAVLPRLLLAGWAGLGWLLAPILAIGLSLRASTRRGLRSRLGFPEVHVEPGAVWLHAASLGEGQVVAALVPALREAHPGVPLLRTWTSAAAADQPCGVDQVLAAPLDVSPCIKPWLTRVRPRLLVLAEADLWPGWLRACRRRGIPVVVVQARLGPGLARWRRFPALWDELVRGVVFLGADEATARVLGAPALGDLKRRMAAPNPIEASRRMVVGGSTHPGEEEALLAALPALPGSPLLVLAPRRPARFEAVAELIAASGHRFERRSDHPGAWRVPEEVRVVLLDTLGELAGMYQPGRVAFGGGTLRPEVGGHSPAEAVSGGATLVRGPSIHANAAWNEVEAHVVKDAADLPQALAAALAAAPRTPAGDAGVPARVVSHLPIGSAPVPEEVPLRPWLAPVSLAWRAGVALRPAPRRRLPVPVVSVGALTAGGAGKSPVAAWFARRLAARHPLVVARGYGRRPGGDVRREGDAASLGDELAMLAAQGIRVASAPDRGAAVEAALRDGWRGVAILDDALQDPRLHHDVEVVVIDARWPEGGGMIPVGTRRLPLEALGLADLVWVNHGPPPAWVSRYMRRDVSCVTARLVPVGWRDAAGVSRLDPWRPGSVLAFAGVARPSGFAASLRGLGIELELCPFPDHHPFTGAELAALLTRAAGRPLVCTEKDLVRLPPDFPARALVVELVPDDPALVDRVLEARLGPA